MRRPICIIATAFGAGIFCGFYVELNRVGLLLGFAALFLVLTIVSKHLAITESSLTTTAKDLAATRPEIKYIIVFFFLGVACVTFLISKEDPMILLADSHTTIEGTVLEVQKRDDEKYRLIVKVSTPNLEGEKGMLNRISKDSIRGGSKDGKILVNVFGDLNQISSFADIAGRTVQVYGKVELPAQRRNPKTFDYRLYLQTRGIHVLMNVAPHDVELIRGDVNSRGIRGDVKFFINALSKLRHSFIHNATNSMSPHNAGILIGMLFGDKNLLGDDVYDMFQKNGVAHILAVSGLHVGALYIFLSKLLRARRNVFLNIVILGFLFTYVALSAFAPSALRAGGMITMHIASKFLNRRYDLLCAGAGMALVMMYFNPLIIFDMGFQLSFLAIFIISMVLPAVDRIYRSDIVAIVALQGSIAPVIAYLFNYFSVAAFFLNAPVILIAGIIIPIGIVLIPLSYISTPLFSVGVGIVDALCEVMYRLNQFTYEKGNFFINTISPPIWVIFAFYGLLLIGFSETVWIFFKRKENRKIVLTFVLIIALAFAFATPVHENFHKAQIVFVDVGQGDCIHIKTPGGKNILIDGGGSRNFDVGKRVLMPYLLKNGVNKIDIAFISHMHTDHYAGLFSLANNFKISTLALYEANRVIENDILIQTGLRSEQLLYLTAGQVIVVDEDVQIEVLFPERRAETEYVDVKGQGDNENDISLILKVYYRGVSALLTGDLSFKGEDGLFEVLGENKDKLKSDFLKVAHHGSKNNTSDKFLAIVNPDIAVFQVGKNGFGHPTAEVLGKMEHVNAQIYRNDNQGAIGVFINKNGKVEVRTML